MYSGVIENQSGTGIHRQGTGHERRRERTSNDHRYGRVRWALVVRDDHDMRCDRQHLGAKLEGNKHGK